MRTISFTPTVSATFNDNGDLVGVEFNWMDSLNWADPEVEEADLRGDLQSLTDAFDAWFPTKHWGL